MLTPDALFEKQWGRYPELGRVLEKARHDFDSRLYPTSVSSSALDLLRIASYNAALAAASRELLLQHMREGDTRDEQHRRTAAVSKDLYELRNELNLCAGMIKELLENVDQVECEASETADKLPAPTSSDE